MNISIKTPPLSHTYTSTHTRSYTNMQLHKYAIAHTQ